MMNENEIHDVWKNGITLLYLSSKNKKPWKNYLYHMNKHYNLKN